MTNQNNPFVKAETQPRRYKGLHFGETGTLKTRTALQFPSPVVIDMEKGSEQYGKDFDFDVISTTDADQCMQSINWLLSNPHKYKTLIIDPATIYWAALQDKYRAIFMERKQKSPGYKIEFYEFQPADWQIIKAENKRFLRKLIQLDMNVIVTAHQKKLYADGDFMRAIGDTFDGEKSWPYMFDTVIQTFKKGGDFMARVIKDRTFSLPSGDFPFSYAVFEKCFGKESLEKTTESIPLITPEQLKQIEEYEIALEITQVKHQKLLTKYEVESLVDLTQAQATEIINILDHTLTERQKKAGN